MPKIHILPSLLAAHPGRLEEGCVRCAEAGADGLHLDIMDGHFVPNLTMGPAVVKMASEAVDLLMHVHLMITNPDEMVGPFLDAGADTVLIHVEARCEPDAVLRQIQERGARAGLTVNPETPCDALLPWLDQVDEILFMTVHPGFGGQSFMESVMPKIARIRKERPDLDISVDGGVDLNTVNAAAGAGANLIVAGTALFRSEDMARDVAQMRSQAESAMPSALA